MLGIFLFSPRWVEFGNRFEFWVEGWEGIEIKISIDCAGMWIDSTFVPPALRLGKRNPVRHFPIVRGKRKSERPFVQYRSSALSWASRPTSYVGRIPIKSVGRQFSWYIRIAVNYSTGRSWKPYRSGWSKTHDSAGIVALIPKLPYDDWYHLPATYSNV